MSNIRGLVPILLATGLGVVNGLLVFGPAFKDQKERKEELQQALEAARQSDSDGVTLRDAEAAASRTIATRSALRAEQSVKTWWSSLSLWSQDTNTIAAKPRDTLPTEDNGKRKESR